MFPAKTKNCECVNLGQKEECFNDASIQAVKVDPV